MTYPCVNTNHFDMSEGAITPYDYMQWRHVASQTAADATRLYPPRGPAIDDPIHTVQSQWTNNSPIAQNVYALLTRGGSAVVLQIRSMAYIETTVGLSSGVNPADPATDTVLGRFGVGGTKDLFSNNIVPYIIYETRIAERTLLLGNTVVLPPGQTLKARAAVRFHSENWENGTINHGGIEQEAGITSGSTTVDLFAYPALT